ncbi:MAG: hypothetical protein RBR35_16505 [Salinivirgaceae bacterium]|jgi:hypothetical protein|nr:hypothetical protein [Salinivirgaceae bacterium]
MKVNNSPNKTIEATSQRPRLMAAVHSKFEIRYSYPACVGTTELTVQLSSIIMSTKSGRRKNDFRVEK